MASSSPRIREEGRAGTSRTLKLLVARGGAIRNVLKGRRVEMIAEISVVPVGVDATSMRAFVEKAVDAIRERGLAFKVTEMGTNVEGSLDEILAAFRVAHDACLAAGSQRVLATLRIDDRLDRPEHLEEPVTSIH